MAMQYQLAQFPFIALTGVPEYPRAHLALEVRAGQDGQAVWHLGHFGQPFQLESLVDVASAAHGAALLREYRALIHGVPVPLLWAGFPVVGVEFIVLDVEPVPRGITSILFGKGSIDGPTVVARGVCRCVWTLLPVSV